MVSFPLNKRDFNLVLLILLRGSIGYPFLDFGQGNYRHTGFCITISISSGFFLCTYFKAKTLYYRSVYTLALTVPRLEAFNQNDAVIAIRHDTGETLSHSIVRPYVSGFGRSRDLFKTLSEQRSYRFD